MDKQVEQRMSKLELELRKMVSSLKGPNLQRNALHLFSHLVGLAQENPSEWRALLNEEIVNLDEFMDYLTSVWIRRYKEEVDVDEDKSEEVGLEESQEAGNVGQRVEKRKEESVIADKETTREDQAKKSKLMGDINLQTSAKKQAWKKVKNETEGHKNQDAGTSGSTNEEKTQQTVRTSKEPLEHCSYCHFWDEDEEVMVKHYETCETGKIVNEARQLNESIDEMLSSQTQ